MEAKRTIQLPQSLCEMVEKQVLGKFPDLESLIIFILERLTDDDGLQFDEQEEQIIQNRLRELGYL
jgi:hypothetical protein